MHKATMQTEILVGELSALARQIDAGLISMASRAARREWKLLRRQWPSAAQIRAGSVAISDGELALMVDKVRRFKAILERVGPVFRPTLAAAAAAFAQVA